MFDSTDPKKRITVSTTIFNGEPQIQVSRGGYHDLLEIHPSSEELRSSVLRLVMAYQSVGFRVYVVDEIGIKDMPSDWGRDVNCYR
jgi:hypothetical protein